MYTLTTSKCPGSRRMSVCGLKMLKKCLPKVLAFTLSEIAKYPSGLVTGGGCCFMLSLRYIFTDHLLCRLTPAAELKRRKSDE